MKQDYKLGTARKCSVTDFPSILQPQEQVQDFASYVLLDSLAVSDNEVFHLVTDCSQHPASTLGTV